MVGHGKDVFLGIALSLLAFGLMALYSPGNDERYVSGQAYLPPHEGDYYALKMETEPILEGIIEQSKGRLVATSDSSPAYVNFAIVELAGGTSEGICELSNPSTLLPCGTYLLISLTNDEPLEGVWVVGGERPIITAVEGEQAEILLPTKNRASVDIRLLLKDGTSSKIPAQGTMNIVLVE